jgi:uncharacterized protein
MRIDVARIPQSGIVLEAEEPPQIMGEAPDGVEYGEPIRVRLSVNLVGRTLVVQGTLSVSASLECNRCLREFNRRLEVSDYSLAMQVKGDETVDLTESIREDIILSLPMKRLCSPDCKGLCPVCGEDRNVSTCGCRQSEVPGPFAQLDDSKL